MDSALFFYTVKLPARFLHARDEAVRGHFAELYAAYAEQAHVAFGTTCHLAAVVQSDGIRVAGQSRQPCKVAGSFESGALRSIFFNEFKTLNLACFHRFFCHDT